jgi:hypothetical protein
MAVGPLFTRDARFSASCSPTMPPFPTRFDGGLGGNTEHLPPFWCAAATTSHQNIPYLGCDGKYETPGALASWVGNWAQARDSQVTGLWSQRRGWPRVFCGHFVLIGAMNPCPCGFYGDPVQECTCSNAMVSRYQADRRHLTDVFYPPDLRSPARPDRPGAAHIEVPRVEATLRVDEKLSDERLGEPSAAIRARVEAVSARRRGSDSSASRAPGCWPLRHLCCHKGGSGGGAGLLPVGRSRAQPHQGRHAAAPDERPGLPPHSEAGADDGPKNRAGTWRGMTRSRRCTWRRRCLSIARDSVSAEKVDVTPRTSRPGVAWGCSPASIAEGSGCSVFPTAAAQVLLAI